MSLEKIAALSREFGAVSDFVQAGGGNASWKNQSEIFIKPSGASLAEIQADDFVGLDRAILQNSIETLAKAEKTEQESLLKRHIAFAVCKAKDGSRPSVETLVHELFPQAYVMHLHPTFINAMTCGRNGAAICAELFPEALWLEETNPGLDLTLRVSAVFAEYKKNKGKLPSLMFVQNHGIFAADDDPEKIKTICQTVIEKIKAFISGKGISPEPASGRPFDMDFVRENAPVLRGLLSRKGTAAVAAMDLLDVPEAGPFTPDHIVYSGAFPLITDSITAEAVDGYEAKYGCPPRVILVPGKALFAAGENSIALKNCKKKIQDSANLLKYTEAFGGPRACSKEAQKFIENWNAESYRRKISNGIQQGPLAGKIALVTGGAQGFGYGIAIELIAAGAHVIVADLNKAGAEAAAQKLGKNASAAAVDVSSEDSITAMADQVIREFGGLDLFVSNAGVLKAGSVKTLAKKDWDFVTNVNYTGYFLCVKHFSPMMALQNQASGKWTDIVQVNSKSGLAGSNKNGAYAAGKFGTIGMTQSFALELVADRIKVNSVCPGNYYDGPLWSDPVRGLFKQYLDAGKVPGAKTVQDVKEFYLKKSPIQRGCFPADIALAIIYAVAQQFETGQAIPVTGGQIMLN